MASLHSSLLQHPFALSSLTLLLFLISLPPSILSQDPTSSSPTIAQCTTRLLPLASCASFVQGTSQSPAQSCCDNLKLLYSQQPDCLCLLLNSTTLSSFPINTTRALQLPALCSLQVDISACSGNFWFWKRKKYIKQEGSVIILVSTLLSRITSNSFMFVHCFNLLLFLRVVLLQGYMCLLAHLVLKFPLGQTPTQLLLTLQLLVCKYIHLLHLCIILLMYVMVSHKEINYQKIVRTHQLD